MTPAQAPLDQAPGRLAYAPTPLDDESIDGYLEHVASRMGIPPRRLHRHLGLTVTNAYSLVRGLTPAQAQNLSAATDLPESSWRAMTLQRYNPVGLMPPPDKRGHGTGVWTRASGARYCPYCLRERDLRWRLSGYVQWTYICLRHERMMETRCPQCGRPVRTHIRGHASGGNLAARTPDTSCACQTDRLASSPSTTFDERAAFCVGPMLTAQRKLNDVIHGEDLTVTALGRNRPRLEWLNDVAALTRLLATHLPTDRIPSGYVDILVSDGGGGTSEHFLPILDQLGSRLELAVTASPAKRLRDLTLSPVAFALTASAAVLILDAPSIETARAMLSVLPDQAREAAVKRSSRRNLSWQLAHALEVERKRVHRGTARTYRITSARMRPDGTVRPPLDPSKVPSRLWPLALQQGGKVEGGDGYRELAASVAILSIGTRSTPTKVCSLLGRPHLAGKIGRDILDVLGLAHGQVSDLFDELVELHDALATSRVPIDYARRRRTFAHPVPPAERTFRRIARELDLKPTPRLRRFMGWWIFEQLTGDDVLLAPEHIDVHASHRIAYRRQRQVWDADPPAALLRRAEHALLVNSLDEPIRWAPRRSASGAWDISAPAVVRALMGWTNRQCRGESRVPGAAGLTLEEAVALAEARQTQAAERLAIKMARFAVVARSGNITRAASELGLRQSTMTSCVRSLERELGQSLLERGTHSVTVTSVGRRLQHLVTTGSLRTTDPTERLFHGVP